MNTVLLRNAALFLCSGLAGVAMTDVLSAQRGGRGNAAERSQSIVDQFDEDANGFLDTSERAAAREWLRTNRPAGRGGERRGRRGGGGRGRGGRGGRGGQPPAPELPKTFVNKDEVSYYPDRELYDTSILRTIFLDFPQEDWMAELDDFYRTDVEVPATMFVDGETYEGVGTAFRGNSSYFAASGAKKSFNITTDFLNSGQRLYGYKTLNLLSGHADPSFLREVIHSEVGNRYFPVMRANLVKLVINGENWGVYANVQQYNKDFLADAYDNKKGVRWKVPAGDGGALVYQGDERAPYERSYQLKTKISEPDEAWQSLINLCRVLDQTPDRELERTLPEILDIDATLWFLAMDLVILDGDGYFSRGSDYLLYEDREGRFRPVPYDSNEILARRGGGRGQRGGGRGQRGGGRGQRGGGRGGRGGRGGGRGGPATVDSPPFALSDMGGRALTRLFAVPAWRARYLAHVRTLALEGMEWSTLGPFLEQQVSLIDAEVRIDDKGLYGYERFAGGLEELRGVVEARRTALLQHQSLSGPWPEISAVELGESAVDGDTMKVHVRAVVSSETALSMVLLYVREKRLVPYRAIPMYDDGAHEDGASGDGVFGAEAGTFETGKDLWLYIEARSAAGEKSSFHPAAAEGRPMVAEIGKG